MLCFILEVLALPVLGPSMLVHWVGTKVKEAIDAEELDEEGVRGELLELEQRHDIGEVDEEEYAKQEEALLERLAGIREAKAQDSHPPEPRQARRRKGRKSL